MQTQSILLNLAKYDLTNLFCFLGKPISLLYPRVQSTYVSLEPTMSTKRRREKKETLSIDRSKLWNGGLGVYPVAIGVTIVPLQAALALTRRMLKFCTGTLPHKWAVIVSEGDMSFWVWSVISKISQVEIAKSSEPQVRIFYVNKTTQKQSLH